MLSFFLNKQPANNAGKQDNAKLTLDKVAENEHTQVLNAKELHNIEGGHAQQNPGTLKSLISLDDFFSGPVPQ
jgi:hypothetical protein